MELKELPKDRKIYLTSSKRYEGVENLDLLKIEFIKVDIELDKYDLFIFTSKNAVFSLCGQYSLKDKKCCAVSGATAKVLKDYGADVVYTGEKGHGDSFGIELGDKFKGKKTLYLRGERTASDLYTILNENSVSCEQLVVYKSSCSKKEIKKPEKNSVIIFTSPSNIECFMNFYSWDESYFAVAIGNTTAKKLQKGIKYTISKAQNIESCIEIARQI